MPAILSETNIGDRKMLNMILSNFGTKFGHVRIIFETLV